MTPDRPPMMNIAMKPSAKYIGVRICSEPPQMVPIQLKIFNWMGTIWGGSLQMRTPMYFALGFIAMFIIGGLSGVMHASPPADLQQNDTYFIVAHFHYVLFGGSIMGLFAGIYYWFPKAIGRLMSEKLGKWHFW